MSQLAVIPGLAPGLLALLPQIILLLFALVVVLLSPRTWWRALVYSIRRPQWILALALISGVGWFGIDALSAFWPEPVAGDARKLTVGEFFVGDSRRGLPGSRARGPALDVVVESYPLAAPPRGEDLFTAELIYRADGATGRITCTRITGGEPLWTVAPGDDGDILFPLVLAGRAADGRELPGYLLALSAAGALSGVPDAAGEGTRVRVIDAAGGAILSAAVLDDRAVEPPVVVDEMLVIACRGSLQALSLLVLPWREKAIAWRCAAVAGTVTALAGDENGHCLILSEALSAVDIETGVLVATSRLETLLPSTKAFAMKVHRGLVYLLTGAGRPAGGGGGISCLELLGSAFEERWRMEAPGVRPDGFALSADRLACLTLEPATGGELVLVEAATGRGIWKTAYSRPGPAVLAVDLSACYVALAGGELSRFSHVRGREDWRVSLGSGGEDSPVAARPPLLRDGMVLVAGERRVFRISESSSGGREGWLASRADAGRSGNLDQRRAPLAGKILWRRGMAAAAGRDFPAGSDPLLPLGANIISIEGLSTGGSLLHLDEKGRMLGKLELPAAPAGVVSSGGRLLLLLGGGDPGADPDGELLAVEASGEKLHVPWRRSLPGLRTGSLCLLGDGCVVTGEDSLLLVDGADGKTAWERQDLGGVVAFCPSGRDLAVARGRVLLLLDAGSGGTLRTFAAREAEVRFLSSAGRTLYLTSGDGNNGLLEALSRDTGKLLWSRRLRGRRLGAGIASGEDCLVVAEENVLTSLTPVSGRQLFPFSSSVGWRGAPALALGMMVAVDGDRVVAHDPVLGGELWNLDLEGETEDGPFSSVSIIGGRVYLRSAVELVCVGEEEAR